MTIFELSIPNTILQMRNWGEVTGFVSKNKLAKEPTSVILKVPAISFVSFFEIQGKT